MMYRYALLVIALFFLLAQPAIARYDPHTVPNNIFGIHIADVNDLDDAATLVNSSGGDWGYVTVVIQDNDRNTDKWQHVFDLMRRRHVIPIVRLATHIDGDAWVKPYQGSAADWARFLNSLNWPTENRYVIVYNEPNHANEWGREINPEEYAAILNMQTKALHEQSDDFFVLPAGLDVSAQSDGKSMDAATYWSRMKQAHPDVFDGIDGWTSHSYPNPAFSGSPYATGRGTVQSYLWEIYFIRTLGVTKELPIFITETGWIHAQGIVQDNSLLSSETTGNYLTIATYSAWSNPALVAVTPFVLNYQGLPFDHFSWRRIGSAEFYPHYAKYQAIQKIQGAPKQREKYTLDHRLLPDSLVAGSTYTLTALLKNEGQGILSQKDGYVLRLETDPKQFLTVYDPLPVMEPGQFGTLTIHTETPNTAGTYPYTLKLIHHDSEIVLETGNITLMPPPSVRITIQLGWKKDSTVHDATILIYDLALPIHKVQGVTFTKGTAVIRDLRNIIPGKRYRIVVLVPYYLPRQTTARLNKDTTDIRLSRLYPLDYNLDGTLSFADIWAMIRMKPNFISSLFISP